MIINTHINEGTCVFDLKSGQIFHTLLVVEGDTKLDNLSSAKVNFNNWYRSDGSIFVRVLKLLKPFVLLTCLYCASETNVRELTTEPEC